MLELTGYDATARRGFKKLFFETKKDGGLTKNAETANTLKQDDWVEITMDDTSYKNVQSIRIIAEPAGSNVPSQAGGAPASNQAAGGSSSASGGSSKMSKAEWAAKQAKEALGIARSVALKVGIEAVSADGKGFTEKKMGQIKKMVTGFTSFLITGDFEGKLPEVVVPAVSETPADKQPGDDQSQDGPPTEPPAADDTPIDDDIPF
jgi:hypothetical protein